VLDNAAGSAAYWWVGRDGVTNIGRRPSATCGPVIDWDPARQVATFEADDMVRLVAGASLVDERIGQAKTIRELEVRIEGASVRAFGRCWETSASTPNYGRLSRALGAIVRRHTGGQLWGSYRYRVASMAGKRVNLEVVSRAAGVPSLLPVTMWPGIAGAEITLKQGAQVLVEFEEGDRGKPFISHYTPVGGDGFVPVSLALCGGTRSAAGVGDEVKVFLNPGVPVPVTGTLSGAPFVGTATFAGTLPGVISTGTPLVKLP
jgi:hypothetical protein